MYTPLSEKLRPTTFDQIVGQDHLVGNNGFLTRLIQDRKPLSVLLWGPPGSGKTTMAAAYSKAFSAKFIPISAVTTGITELKKIIEEIQRQPLLHQQPHIFVDEIHRYNKAQQDFFLPFLEQGTFVLTGATTENPSFALNNALLSRLRVLTLNAHTPESLEKILNRYEKQFSSLNLLPEARSYLIQLAQGDGRYILNLVENFQGFKSDLPLGIEDLKKILQRKASLHDKSGDYHYNLISALHKSVRGSDPDASLYWFCRMLEGGEDPLFIARRVIRMASEDIGLADPQALQLAISAKITYENLGSPEGELALAEAVVYLALAPKSNAIYTAYKEARNLAKETSHMNPPSTILNAPTQLMKDIGYGRDYQYDHDTPHQFSGQHYFPKEMERHTFYTPKPIGFEREMQKRVEYFRKLRENMQR